ncbi:hypothetical protein [Streptomyces sp. NPDC041003]|uniref:hypothetical protein n=1 Tax=Streptomyces sp. NPDC041003 TaxID=3155730 RepID=UPI003400A882
MPKAVAKFRDHSNYRRDGWHSTDELHDFVFHANGDMSREIKMAFLPFHLPKRVRTGPAGRRHNSSTHGPVR